MPPTRFSDLLTRRTPRDVTPIVLSLETVHQPSLLSKDTRPRGWLGWLHHRRRIGMFFAGGLCAIGLFIALSNPAGSSPESAGTHDFADDMAPSQTNLDTQILESPRAMPSDGSGVEAERDPRAAFVELALSGIIDEIPEKLDDIVAEVTSRNGDIVLLDVVATTGQMKSRFNVVLVRSTQNWVVREVYAAGQETPPLSGNQYRRNSEPEV